GTGEPERGGDDASSDCGADEKEGSPDPGARDFKHVRERLCPGACPEGKERSEGADQESRNENDCSTARHEVPDPGRPAVPDCEDSEDESCNAERESECDRDADAECLAAQACLQKRCYALDVRAGGAPGDTEIVSVGVLIIHDCFLQSSFLEVVWLVTF